MRTPLSSPAHNTATSSPEPLIKAEGLSIQLGERQILQGIDIALQAGEIVTVIGPNGAGKSTLAKCLLGLLPAYEGKVHRQTKLRIGYMPQKLMVDTSLPITVERFVRLSGGSKSQAKQAMEKAGISALANAQVAGLSGGETQRLLLARALIRQPQLLVLDEPEQGMDITGQSELYRLIAQLRDELNCGVLLISHELHLVMAATDHVICLNQHICCQGHPEQIQTNPAYLELFGAPEDSGLAVYTHQHDHSHDLHGDVVNHQCSHDHHSANSSKTHEAVTPNPSPSPSPSPNLNPSEEAR